MLDPTHFSHPQLSSEQQAENIFLDNNFFDNFCSDTFNDCFNIEDEKQEKGVPFFQKVKHEQQEHPFESINENNNEDMISVDTKSEKAPKKQSGKILFVNHVFRFWQCKGQFLSQQILQQPTVSFAPQIKKSQSFVPFQVSEKKMERIKNIINQKNVNLSGEISSNPTTPQ